MLKIKITILFRKQNGQKEEIHMTLKEFQSAYPAQTMVLPSGKSFTYRFYAHPTSEKTVVLLTGGIGLSDLFYLHFQRFARDFSVLTFDYQMNFQNNREFAQGVSQLLQALHRKAWLVGQSLGGIVAQIIAAEHPQVVEGLVLSNTCSLSANMDESAADHLSTMILHTRKSKKLLKFVPFGLYKKLIKAAVMKKTADFTGEEKQLMAGLCDGMLGLLTKPYEEHMLDFLLDAENHLGMKKQQFTPWKGRVLLILSEDDHTFNDASKKALIDIMPEPKVVTDLTGGHLALLVRLESYAELVSDFIRGRL